jgi:hypothetical protein
VGISEYEENKEMRKKYKNILWKMYFLKTTNYSSDCDHVNKLRLVKISNFYLQ